MLIVQEQQQSILIAAVSDLPRRCVGLKITAEIVGSKQQRDSRDGRVWAEITAEIAGSRQQLNLRGGSGRRSLQKIRRSRIG